MTDITISLAPETLARLQAEAERRNLSIDRFVNMILDLYLKYAAEHPQRSLSELRGLGKEIWAGIDAQEYIDQLRAEWDKSNTPS